MGRDLSRLLSPKSIAVLGGIWADTVAEQCEKLGFPGQIYRVHPKRAQNGDEGCWPSLSELPEVPDAIFIGVNRGTTIEIVAEASKIGVGGAICFASGFEELHTPEGKALTVRLLEAAGDMPFLGPNCYGAVNLFDRMSMFPDQVPRVSFDEGVFIISQSGTIVCNILYSERSLPVGYLVSVGNQATITISNLIDAALADDRVTAIGIYLENIPDLSAFTESVAKAREKGIPVAVLKSGRSEIAKRTVYSHTGKMGGQTRYLEALFERLGVACCETLAELIETLKFLHVHGPLHGNGLAVAGASGGEMALAADVFEPMDLTLPELEEQAVRDLQSVLGNAVTVANPLDFHTYIWLDEEKLQHMFTAFLAGRADISAFVVDHPNPVFCDASTFEAPVRAFLHAAKQTKSRAVTISSMSESHPPGIREMCFQAGVAPLQGMRESFRAIEQASKIGHAWEDCFPPEPKASVISTETETLSEYASKSLLSGFGIPVPASKAVPITEAETTAESLGYPVVVKASSEDLEHKTERGGVALNLQNGAAVSKAARHMATLSDTILVEQMIADGVAELIVGIDVDPQFGPVVLMGAGGVLAELIEDSVVLLPPYRPKDIEQALSGLKISKLLNGYRGGPKGDKVALIEAVMAVGAFAEAHSGTLVELDINPLIVRPEGKGVMALDALIRRNKLEA